MSVKRALLLVALARALRAHAITRTKNRLFIEIRASSYAA